MSNEPKIRYITFEQANSFYSRWHYFGFASKGKQLGFFDGSSHEIKNLVGVATLKGVGSRYVKSLLFSDATVKVIELSRFACVEDFRPESKLLSMLFKLVKNEGYDAILSYSDIGQGHVGTIYQATNFIYTGLNSKQGHPRFIIDGKEVSPRQLYSLYGTSAIGSIQQKIPEVIVQPRARKHRYVLPLNHKTRKKLKLCFLPYPKKIAGEVSRRDTELPSSGVVQSHTPAPLQQEAIYNSPCSQCGNFQVPLHTDGICGNCK